MTTATIAPTWGYKSTANDTNDRFAGLVRTELDRALALYPPMNSLHEGYAVLQEEVDELWDEIKLKPALRSKERLRDELVQVAAMCARMALDLDLLDR